MTQISVTNKVLKEVNDKKSADIEELCDILYLEHTSIARLYAFASGRKKARHETAQKHRSLADNKRLLWSVKILKKQMSEYEEKLKALVISSH